MTDTSTYTGGCHCGKVRFEAKTNLSSVMQCNCSMCAKAGYLLTFVQPEQFMLLSGENDLSDYQFNKKAIHHLFCTSCGIRSFGRGATPDGKMMYAVNVRCLDGVELEGLPITKVDGKSF